MNKKFHTTFLFATPSFIIGMGSVLNIAGNYFEFNDSPSDKEADLKAIRSDWDMIGQDITESILIMNEKELEKDETRI